MVRGIRSLLRGSTYSGAFFGFCGALASLPLLPFAALPALAWPSASYGARVVLTLLVWAALIGLVGLARPTRRLLIAGARRLLRVPLPDPVAVHRPVAVHLPVAVHRPVVVHRPARSPDSGATSSARAAGSDRWRTPVWLLLHVALGWATALLCVSLILAGLVILLVPVDGMQAEAGISLFGRTARADGGWGSRAVALGCVPLGMAGCAVLTGTLRWLAPKLLGPSSAERLALAAEREMALAERNKLAHELHDSIGHTLTAATIQAAVAGEVLSADPAAARAAMRSIEESTRAALEDLDYVLGVLRAETADATPTRTLADLPELLDRLRHAGAVVEPELSGELAQVQGTLSRAAYRILQEGLTNALRHGTGGPIEVRVAAAPDVLELGVVNRTGAGTGPRAFPTSGHGLPGLAERVRLLHGEIEAGPDGPEHWRLAVRLPVQLSA
ncbi:sensor histidine kinase [Streptomyces sp. UNOB3_S3]|uniref:sensor histidine kinase n=1 Tax=Streptomyces sp. UNOB3_S3 TaxID=2871682 RepID=UPI001E398846|nr:histidine kinase [Streptomyces sp. UNOB3_S3]MCC3777141.1 two-component sensor histidine kinase [Streptomyces sp. UNOB3_S3]